MRKIMGALLVGVTGPLLATGAIAADFDLGNEAIANAYDYNPGSPSPFEAAFFGNATGGLSFTSQSGKLFATTGLTQIGVDVGGNSATFTGNGSNWQSEMHVYIGVETGGNTLTVSNGASLSFARPVNKPPLPAPQAVDVIVGYDDGGDDNTLTVTGGATRLTTDGTIYVGRNGDDNAMNVQDGAVVTSLQGRIGGGSGSISAASDNTVTIDGEGSKWQMSGTLHIGSSSTAATTGNLVTVQNGGALATGKTIHLGYGALSSDNELTITGEGSNVTTAGDVKIGSNGASTGNIVTVEETASLDVTGQLYVGNANTLSLASGAAVTAGNLFLTAANDPAKGSLLSFDVDAANLATLNVTDGAVLGGEFEATFSGSLEKRIDILTAGAGLSGTTFDTVDTSDLARGFDAAIYYGLPITQQDPNSIQTVYLGIEAKLGREDELGGNQRNVAEGLNTSFNGGQRFSEEFVAIYKLENPDLQTALTELSGEANAYGLSSGVWNSDGSLLQMLRERALHGANGGWGAISGNNVSADGVQTDGTNQTDDSNSAFSGGLTLGQGTGFSAGLGLSVGQSDWDLGGLGAGSLKSAQVGGFVKADFGTGYLTASGVMGQHDMTVARASYQYVPEVGPFAYAPAETLGLDLGVTSNALRLEAGYAVSVSDAMTVTPYAAYAMGQTMVGQSATETGNAEAVYGLTYAEQTIQTQTKEIGARFDAKVSQAMGLYADISWSSANSDKVRASFTGLENSGFELAAAGSEPAVTKLTLGATFGIAETSSAFMSLNGSFGDVSAVGGSAGMRFSW
jgi:T5SS/PEP-CTERM-associated repeat protein